VWSQHRPGLDGNKAASTFAPIMPGFPESEFVLEAHGRLLALVRCDQTGNGFGSCPRMRNPGCGRVIYVTCCSSSKQYWALAGYGSVPWHR